MKRLRDTEPDSPLVARATKLLESVEALPDDAARMQRVRRALDEGRAGARAQRRWPALGLAVALGLFGASAFGAVRFVAEWRAQPVPVPAPALQAAPAKGARRVPGEKAPEPEALPAAEPVLEPAAKESGKAPRRVPPQARSERTPAEPEAPPAPTADSMADSPHSALVHEALQALRHQNEPARAARLLQEYAARAPQGPLAEEALSLRIEALQALHDPRGRALASQYLQRYPQGRYVAVARRALAEPAP